MAICEGGDSIMSRKRRRRKKVPRGLIETERQEQKWNPVKTFRSGKTGKMWVSHNEPMLQELFEVQKQRNKQAQDQPDKAERLTQIQHELERRGRAQRFNALEIGGLYYEAKKLLPHGNFKSWVEKVGLYSHSAALNYMRVYEVCCGRPELVEDIKPTALQIMCEPNFPDDLREEVFRHRGHNGTIEDLKKVAKRVQSGELQVESEDVQVLLRDVDYEARHKVLKEVLEALATDVEQTRRELQKLVPASAEVGQSSSKGFLGEVKHWISDLSTWQKRLTGET